MTKFLEGRKNLRHTLKKVPPSKETLEKLKDSVEYKMEREFYDFVAAEFENQWSKLMDMDGEFVGKQYHYEKIKP